MKRVVVALGERSYPITIAAGLFNDPDSFLPLRSGNSTMLVTNETLSLLYLDKIRQVLKKAGVKVDHIILPDGEQYKNLTVLDMIFTELLQKSHGRDTTLIALGGGSIGDLTGFAAASYQRGVRLIQVPTTLLSQVDSAIGGKTAVNHRLGKNMIGAFYQPASVVVDLDCLKTLSFRELVSGFAEIIKYGIILDAKFFSWLEENIDALLSLNIESIEYCIYHCCSLKADIIATDEYENGLRVLLNFGHTYGHAIETEMGYGNWLHGEAIAAGMMIAARTSEKLGYLKKEETQRIGSLLKRAGLPVNGPHEMSVQAYLSRMIYDKKVLSGELRLVLPLEIGKSKFFSGVSKDVILDAINDRY